MHKTPALLKRWAAQFPGTVYPSSASDLSGEQRMYLSANDPELGQILSGEAPVELELQVMEGTLADNVVPRAQREAEANKAEAQRLVDEGVFGRAGYYAEDGSYVEPIERNLSGMMRVAQLSDELYAAEMLKAQPPQAKPGALNSEQAAFVRQQLAEQNEARLESLQAAGYFGED